MLTKKEFDEIQEKIESLKVDFMLCNSEEEQLIVVTKIEELKEKLLL